MGHQVPLLLEQFPVPPQFIPPSAPRSPSNLSFNHSSIGGPFSEASSSISSSSLTSSSISMNPPPSLPPAGPLPPIPGRSKISDHEAVALILQSRRNSRYSTRSSHSGSAGHERPDSVASFASARSNATSYTSGHGNKDYTKENRRASRNSDTNQAYGGLRIDEEENLQLTSMHITISPLPPSPTESEHELVIPTSLSTQFPTPPPLSPFAIQQANAIRKASSSTASSPLKWSAPSSPLDSPNATQSYHRPGSPSDSIAEISMYDLPSIDDGAESEWDVPTTKPATIKASSTHRAPGIQHPPSSFSTSCPPRSESRSSLRRMARISVENVDSVSLRASMTSPPPSPNPSRLANSPPLRSAPSVFSVSSSTASPSPPPLASAPANTALDDADIHRSLHRELRSARSRSRSHRERLNSDLSASARPPIPPIPSDNAPTPRRKVSQASSISGNDDQTLADDDEGRASPDIEKLLEKTPRPRRSLSRVSRKNNGRRSGGTSRQGSTKGSIRRRKSDYVESEEEWDEFGAPKVRGRKTSQRRLAHHEEAEDKLRKLERELDGVGSESETEDVQRQSYGVGFGFGVNQDDGSEGFDSDASDSSLDLHTPLPNLMLRHGLLSPQSKLLPASSSVDSLASLAVEANGDGRPTSTMSMVSNASIQTKSGLLKDTRDTTSRRQRHKDGRLLRGGIGLTTGLGWSDSEDEGAPSALTRRLSSLNLSRQSSLRSLSDQRMRSKSYGNLRGSVSVSSLSRPSTLVSGRSSTFSYGSQSNHTNPLSRSYSSRTLDTDLNEEDEVGDFGEAKSYNSPPSTWSGKKFASTGEIRSFRSSSSTLSLKTSSKSGERTPKFTNGNRIARSGSEASLNSTGADDLSVLTPSSTSSSVSIPLPVTPKDDSLPTPTPSFQFSRSDLNLDKGLPSLPNPRTGSIRRPTAPSSISTSKLRKRSESSITPSTKHSFPSVTSDHNVPSSKQQLWQSSSSSLLQSNSAIAQQPTSSSSPQPPRQLQLPRHSVMNVNGQLPVPVPSIHGGSTRLRQPSTPSPAFHQSTPATPTTPMSPTTDSPKPRSRVGAGMAYRTSSSTNTLRMKPPSGKTPIVTPRF